MDNNQNYLEANTPNESIKLSSFSHFKYWNISLQRDLTKSISTVLNNFYWKIQFMLD